MMNDETIAAVIALLEHQLDVVELLLDVDEFDPDDPGADDIPEDTPAPKTKAVSKLTAVG